MKFKKKGKSLDLIGWREWVSLPELRVKSIKAKIDTGARTSSLHVSYIKKIAGSNTLQFIIHPDQDSSEPKIHATAIMIEERSVKSSNGASKIRPVIQTSVKLGGEMYTVELTLVNRDLMGFRMLLGREALKNRFLVDSGKSFLLPSPKPKPKKKNRREK
ncbi:MAG: hypothetical protein NPINA01_26860 [Nitrospinaceae bacterium]|nr:MAG: hypothetical protein NPINA01_26860 [Nitrospinaceae bacterium]